MLDYKAIDRRIAFYRKKNNMTQAVLSEKLDVSESYVSQIEKGVAKVSLGRLSQISELLDIDLSLLVSDKGSVFETPINSEIFQIIKDWSSDQISLLVDLLTCADEKLNKK